MSEIAHTAIGPCFREYHRNLLLSKIFSVRHRPDDAFSEVPGRRPSSFQGITECDGILWLRSQGAENTDGEGMIRPYRLEMTRP